MERTYPSRYIIQNKADYYRLLLEVTSHGRWEEWIMFMLRAIEETAKWTTAKISAIKMLADSTAQYVKQAIPKIYSRELVDTIFEQPYCRIANLVENDVAQRQSASKYLHELVRIGVLRETALGKEKLFVHPKLMQLLARDSNAIEPYSA